CNQRERSCSCTESSREPPCCTIGPRRKPKPWVITRCGSGWSLDADSLSKTPAASAMAAPARPTRLFSVPALTAHEPRLVAGKYRLTRLLGRGGMGTVWEGVHTTLGTRVAVKFIDAEYAQSTEARSRFENEARAAAALRSKHVVEIHDHGVGEDGCPFIVMEYLEGETRDQKLDRVVRISPQETALIIHQVCRALAKAYAPGLVPRDLT